MNTAKERIIKRKRRHNRIRKKIIGTQEKPRFSVFKSLKHMYVQIIDDIRGETILGLSTLSKDVKEKIKGKKKTEQAFILGEMVGKLAIEKGLKEVVFDRGGFKYHGRVKAVADGARKSGLKF